MFDHLIDSALELWLKFVRNKIKIVNRINN